MILRHRQKAKISQAMEDAESAKIKGIPEFWLTAIKNHPLINEMLTGEQDEEALKHLVDIKTHYLTDNGI